jgi:hypothetical protein
MPVEIPQNKDTVPEPFAKGDDDTPRPTPRPPPPARAARPLRDPDAMPRLGTRPTPFEKAQAWAAWSKQENARQAAAAAMWNDGEAIAELRARRAGLPWPPEGT